MNKLGIYIHIPFCIKKCSYCDFLSFVDYNNYEEYFTALLNEIKLYDKVLSNYRIDSIYFGGGTPSYIDPKYIKRIINKLNEYNISDNCEITLEVNPGTITEDKLKLYKDCKINRISIGLQSANDSELKLLGRIHNYSDFEKSYELIKKYGFNNINIDIIYGIPNQNSDSFLNTLKAVKEKKPTHISAYSLIIEKNTPIYEMKNKNLPDEEAEYKMFLMISDVLDGYERYEISNYAQEGFQCRHNLKYWKMEDYLGLGINAHSFVENKRYYNYNILNEYYGAIKKGILPIEHIDNENEDELIKDYIITGLRLKEGISIGKINERFNIDFSKKYKNVLDKYKTLEMMEQKGDNLKLTDKGIYVSNYILSDFI